MGTHLRTASLALFALSSPACRPRHDRADRPELTAPPAHSTARVPTDVPAHIPAPAGTVAQDPEACSPSQHPTVAPDWTLLGDRPGPSLRSLVATGPHRRTLLGATASRVCVSDDDGARWREALGQASPGDTPLDRPVVTRLGESETLVVIAQGTESRPSAPRVFTSIDGARWSPLTLPSIPAPSERSSRVFTDRSRRIYVATATRLWRTDSTLSFGDPIELPGTESDQVDACGDTLIARAHIGSDTFFHRSDDHGRTWRPFRLGVLGIEGGNVVLRCLGWRGGIEAGRAPLPTHWTFDQGRSWEPARYDATARLVARSLADDPSAEGEPPRCAQTPSGQLVCTDSGRLVLPDAWHRAEVHAPARCEHVRLLDDQRMVAFGPACGLLLSTDRGGLWRPLSVSLSASSRGASARGAVSPSGRAGYISRDTAWRLDGGIWWTRDSGEHWRVVPSPTGRTLERGVFVDTERGVFAQSSGWVLSTRDGGRGWTYVIRGEVERIASGGRWVMVTTSDRVRLSGDGGETWMTSGTIPAHVAITPSVEVFGSSRRVDLTPSLRVLQQSDSISMVFSAPDRAPVVNEILRDLRQGHDLLAAHATAGTLDRVLLSSGAMLVRRADLSRR